MAGSRALITWAGSLLSGPAREATRRRCAAGRGRGSSRRPGSRSGSRRSSRGSSRPSARRSARSPSRRSRSTRWSAPSSSSWRSTGRARRRRSRRRASRRCGPAADALERQGGEEEEVLPFQHPGPLMRGDGRFAIPLRRPSGCRTVFACDWGWLSCFSSAARRRVVIGNRPVGRPDAGRGHCRWHAHVHARPLLRVRCRKPGGPGIRQRRGDELEGHRPLRDRSEERRRECRECLPGRRHHRPIRCERHHRTRHTRPRRQVAGWLQADRRQPRRGEPGDRHDGLLGDRLRGHVDPRRRRHDLSHGCVIVSFDAPLCGTATGSGAGRDCASFPCAQPGQGTDLDPAPTDTCVQFP